MRCPTCGTENSPDSKVCSLCGAIFAPGSQNPFSDNPVPPGQGLAGGPLPGQPNVPAPGYYVPGPAPGFPPPGSALPGQTFDEPGLKYLVPIGTSPMAIAAGYLGLFSFCMPLLGPIAVVLGILAIMHCKKNPQTAGMARGIVGVALGAISTIFLFVVIVAIVLGN